MTQLVQHRMVLRHHPVFGHWFVPDIRTHIPHERGFYRLATNAHGMRARETYAVSPAPGRIRVAVFGDSFTAGDGVDNEERFTDRLERLAPSLEVLNFGLPNSGTDQQWLVYEHLGRQFNPDVVIVCPLVENINRIERRYRPIVERRTGRTALQPKPYFTLAADGLTLHGVPVSRDMVDLASASASARADADLPRRPLLNKALNSQALRPLKERVMRLGGHDPFPQYRHAADASWALMQALLMRFADAVGPARLVIAPLPTYHYIEQLAEATYRARFDELARARPDVTVIDPLAAFSHLSAAERRACRYRTDHHYTPLAHEIIAATLRQALATPVTRP